MASERHRVATQPLPASELHGRLSNVSVFTRFTSPRLTLVEQLQANHQRVLAPGTPVVYQVRERADDTSAFVQRDEPYVVVESQPNRLLCRPADPQRADDEVEFLFVRLPAATTAAATVPQLVWRKASVGQPDLRPDCFSSLLVPLAVARTARTYAGPPPLHTRPLDVLPPLLEL